MYDVINFLEKKCLGFMNFLSYNRLLFKNKVGCISFISTFYITIIVLTTTTISPVTARFCMLMPVTLQEIGTFYLSQISTYTITNVITFSWRFKVFMAMSFSNISNTVLFLSNNKVATFLKQTEIKQSCHRKHMKGLKLQSVQQLQAVVSSSKFKSHTFIQIFLGL